MDLGNLPLLTKVKEYRKRATEIKAYLNQHPDEWPRFVAEVTASIDSILLDILNFEKENLTGNEERVYRLKKLFERRFRKYFLYGEIATWSFQKPFGYAGDFKIIDDLYRNDPKTTGFERLLDHYFLELAVSVAVRNRKEDFKNIIRNFVQNQGNRNIWIMNLACGPCREIKEFLEEDHEKLSSHISFDCYDNEPRALEYARGLLNGAVRSVRVNFIQANAVRLALKKDIISEVPNKYNVIYSTGLFDYLDGRIATRLLSNLRKLLRPGGLMAISNVRDKFSNRSAYWMEWILDWNLIYRKEDEFKKIFLDAGFTPNQLRLSFEKQKIWQYCLASSD